MIWLAVVIILFLLCLLPVGVSAAYDRSGATAAFTVSFLRFQIYPRKKKDSESNADAKKKYKDDFESESSQKKHQGTLSDFLPLLRLILDFLSDFKRKLRVRNLELKLILAGGDPADLAINYGRACAAVGNLMPHIERCFVIKKRDVSVACDFAADQTLVDARIDLTITLGGLLWIAGYHGIRIFRKYKTIMNQMKDGATS